MHRYWPKVEVVALQLQNLHSVAGLVEKHKKHWVEHRHFDIQFDEGGQAVDILSKVSLLAPERDREHSIRHQIAELNVGFMARLR